jgi:TnpA family transposase
MPHPTDCHYTDTNGFTDHVFGLTHLLGFRFAPRIRDLGETRLYIPNGTAAYEALRPLIGGPLKTKAIRTHWDEILRLSTSIKQGTVTASLMLRKLGSYPRQNGLAIALRELGRIERTLFILDWLQSVELRRHPTRPGTRRIRPHSLPLDPRRNRLAWYFFPFSEAPPPRSFHPHPGS